MHIKGLRPEARRTSGLVFARRIRFPIFLEGVPRKWGSGGKMTVSARSAKALTGIGPRRFFGAFLIVQKVTRPAKNRLLLSPGLP